MDTKQLVSSLEQVLVSPHALQSPNFTFMESLSTILKSYPSMFNIILSYPNHTDILVQILGNLKFRTYMDNINIYGHEYNIIRVESVYLWKKRFFPNCSIDRLILKFLNQVIEHINRADLRQFLRTSFIST